jgi:hypothetical protein
VVDEHSGRARGVEFGLGTSCARPLVERDQLEKLCAYNSQENLWPYLPRFSCSSWRRILPSTWNVSDGLPTQLL